MDNLDNVKKVLRVLGNPTRLRIFNILMTGAHCNCEIADKSGLAINLISHHLKVLQEVDLVQSERNEIDARWVYYSINQQGLKSFKHAIQEFLDNDRIKHRDPACPPYKIKPSKEKHK
jgi:ArsR family transcriptional regulator